MSISLASSNPPGVIADSSPARRSGGPRTPEGKEQSRRNALKRGLRSKIVFPDDLNVLVEQRIKDFFAEFDPRSSYEEVLVRDMAVSSARFERCASLSIADLIRTADRASYCWEHDRRMSVEDYAARISKDPQRIARGLRSSCQGTDWLIERWEILGTIALETGRWDDDQRRLAFDMLGVPRELRIVSNKVPSGDDVAGLIALVETQVTKLRDEQEAVLDDLNDAEQAMSMSGMPLQEDAATARLRKSESRARNDFAKARTELLRFRAGQSQDESRPKPRTSSDRPSLSNAAIDNLVVRSRGALENLVMEVAEEVAEEVKVEVEFEEAEEPVSVVDVPTPTPTERPRCRQARKVLERRARAADRREASASATR